MKKSLLAGGLLTVAVAFYWVSGQQNLNLASLHTLLVSMDQWRSEHAIAFAALFFAAYVAVTALSLPLAVWMTLAAGALFGLWWGVVIVSFASSLGATLAFLAARYVLRDVVRNRLGTRAQTIEQGLNRDGAFYLFTLRLIPVVPFFAVNLLMGLTPIRVRTFYTVSQIGMLAATVVYVNAGTQLAQLTSLAGIASPGLVFSFALLGLFPWIARLVLNSVNRRKD
ncbi:MAG: TVP38/TMEM64 family protein [Cypionkella sp.]